MMSNDDKIKRIEELLEELNLSDISKYEFDEKFSKFTIEDIKEVIWLLYCFASDVCNALNM